MGKKQKRKLEIMFAVLRAIFIILLIISGLYIVNWYGDIKENDRLKQQVNTVVIDNSIQESEEIKYNIDFNRLKNINSDVVAWLKVNGTKIEYPVVKADNNSYYLKRNLEKKYNVGGWVFLDYKNKLDGTDKNIIVYGHNMKDNSMFGTLKNILNKEWYENEENYILDFILPDHNEKYQVFSIYKIKSEDYYIKTEFTAEDFILFTNTLRKRSIKDFGVEINKEDTILTLSTCADNYQYRIVMHAKKLTI